MTVAAYTSTLSDSNISGGGFDFYSQKKIISEYCKANNMIISDWYADRVSSDTPQNRPALDQLLYGNLKCPPVEAVVVANGKCIADDLKLYYYYLMLLGKKHIELISATEDIVDYGTGLGAIYKPMAEFFSERERDNITKRTSGGRAVKAAAGGYSGGKVPYGYRAENHKLVIEPAEAEVVRKIFAYKDEGEKNYIISCHLNNQGIMSRKGGFWYVSMVDSIVKNRKLYEGYYKYGNDQWVPGQQDAIIKERGEENE